MTALILLVGGLYVAARVVTWISDHIDTAIDEYVRHALDDTTWDQWCDEAIATTDTPIYEQTAAYIAKHAATDLDTEWAQLNGGAS